MGWGVEREGEMGGDGMSEVSIVSPRINKKGEI